MVSGGKSNTGVPVAIVLSTVDKVLIRDKRHSTKIPHNWYQSNHTRHRIVG